MSKDTDFRLEKDSMGDVRVPAQAYWGAQTQRAVDNFPVSDYRFPTPMIRAIAMVKRYAAEVNADLGLLAVDLANAIVQAGEEIVEGKWDDHFPLDVFQTGSGTSTNMNVNEVMANRANEILGQPLGSRKPVHPNDHINRGQSSNDVIPTAIHIAVRLELEGLLSALDGLASALSAKSEQFGDVVKIGRTHLMDAVPMTLGQEFSGYAQQIRNGIARIRSALPHLEELGLGGTALGTGVNTQREFAPKVIAKIAERTGISFKEAPNKFEALASRDALVELMGALNTLAVSLIKIANDIRLLSSGPRTAIGEIAIPSLQPGSSIMPGKVNPVIPEMTIQVAAFIMGSHLMVTIGGQNAPLELNMMMPLIGYQTLTSIKVLTNSARLFNEKCVAGITADAERCAELIEWSMALVTPLALKIGYDRAAQIAYRAHKERKTVRDILLAENILPADEIDRILNPRQMLEPD
jgi:fumarate hydratase class II